MKSWLTAVHSWSPRSSQGSTEWLACRYRDNQKEQQRTIRKVMVGVGKTKNKNFEQEKMSPETFMQSETQRKNFMHDRESWSTQRLCTSIL